MKRGGLFLIFIFSSIGAEFRSPTYVIDIPNAYLPAAYVSGGLNLTLALGGVEEEFLALPKEVPQEMNGYIEVKIPKGPLIGVSIFTNEVIALTTKYSINEETSRAPQVAVGIEGISPNKYISPLGSKEKGWRDDLTYGQRNSEQFSLFVVMTKDLGPYGLYTLGLGRGYFVGYGPRSSKFNSDVFTKKYNNNAIGLFWGAEFPIVPPLSLGFDFDGRDFNVGAKIGLPYFQVGIGIAKIEHRLGGSPKLFPRMALGLNVNYMLVKRMLKRPTGVLVVTVRDVRGGNKRAIITFPGSTIPPAMTSGKTGSCRIKVEPGTYWVRAGIPGYFWADRKVSVGEGQTAICHFEIRSIIP
jgi:hypothetical protein